MGSQGDNLQFCKQSGLSWLLCIFHWITRKGQEVFLGREKRRLCSLLHTGTNTQTLRSLTPKTGIVRLMDSGFNNRAGKITVVHRHTHTWSVLPAKSNLQQTWAGILKLNSFHKSVSSKQNLLYVQAQHTLSAAEERVTTQKIHSFRYFFIRTWHSPQTKIKGNIKLSNSATHIRHRLIDSLRCVLAPHTPVSRDPARRQIQWLVCEIYFGAQ